MSVPDRVLRSTDSSRHLRDLLQTLLCAELLLPSRELWLISPWITDLPLLDNSGGQLSRVAPEWPRARVRLSEVIHHLAGQGSRIRVVTHTFSPSAALADTVWQPYGQRGASVEFRTADPLPEAGLLGDRFLLSGRISFDENGPTLQGGTAELYLDPEVVAARREALVRGWEASR